MSDLVSNSAGLNLELELRPMESIPLAQVREGAEALLNMDVSDDLMPLGIQAGEKPAVPAGAEELVFFYEKQLAATQLVQHRLEKQYNQLVEEKVALETSLSVQTSALQQQLVLAREKAERAFAQAEHAQQKVHGAHAAVGEIVDAVTHLAALLDVSGVTKELTQSFETVARSTQRTFQAVEAAREGAKLVLELQMDAKNTCHVSPLLTAMSSGSHGTDTARRLEEDALRLHKELDDAKRREQELEAEMRAAQLLFSGLEAEVVSLQHDQAQAAAKLQLSQEELLSARDELMIAQQALSSAQSPAAGALTQGLSKLDAHILSVRNFLEGLSMPQSPGILDAIGGSTLQESPSVGSFEGEAEAGIEKLKDLISGLQEQLKVKDGELRAARYASLVVQQRAEARLGQQSAPPRDECPISSGDQLSRVTVAGSRVPTPTFSYLLAARAQAMQSPTVAMGGLSTVQVALIAAEREVLSLRSQLSHRQQHIKLLEQRLLEQSQDIAAMCNRGDALAASPVASRKASFVERRLGVGTEILLPQKAWDFDGLDMSSASGNLAEQMRPQGSSSRISGDSNEGSRPMQVPHGDEDDSSDGTRSESISRKNATGLQVERPCLHGQHGEPQGSTLSLSKLLLERDRTVQQLRDQIDDYRAVLAAAAGNQNQDPGCVGYRQQVNPWATFAQSSVDYNPRITLEDLPEGYVDGVRWADGGRSGHDASLQAAGSSDAPPSFRLSSAGPLPFQLNDELDGVQRSASGISISAKGGAGAAAEPAGGPITSDSGASLDVRELSRSSSARLGDLMKRQLDEAAYMLVRSQDQLSRTTSELTSLQGLLDALSKADPSAAPFSRQQTESGELQDDVQTSPVHQLSVEEVRAQMPTCSGLGSSTNQLNELRVQLQDVMKALQNSQDHLLTMQAEVVTKEASIMRLNEQLQALRTMTGASPTEGVNAVPPSDSTSLHGVVSALGRESGELHTVLDATPSQPLSPDAEITLAMPLSLPVSPPSQRAAVNADADTYTPSLVMNPMFHRDAMGSSEAGSDAARTAAVAPNSSVATGEGYLGAPLSHSQADPSTTVHRNLLFDDEVLHRPKESEQWQYEQHNPCVIAGNFPESMDPDAQCDRGHPALSAPTDGLQRNVGGRTPQSVNAMTQWQLLDASQSSAASGHTPSVDHRRSQQGTLPTSLLRSHHTNEVVSSVVYLGDHSHNGCLSLDDRTDDVQASGLPDAVSVVSDLESELSQRVTELEDEILTERNSFADQLTSFKRAKRDLEARVKELTSELKLKDEQLAQLQEKRGTRGRRPSDNLVSELQQTVANLASELAAKDAGIRLRQDRIDDMEHAQALVTRTISAEIANYRKMLADTDIEMEALRKRNAEAEGLIAELRATNRQPVTEGALVRGTDRHAQTDANSAVQLNDVEVVGRLTERVTALEAELQDATERLEISMRELGTVASELESCTQQLAKVKLQVSAAEECLAAERGAHRELEQQLAAQSKGIAVAYDVGEPQDQPGANSPKRELASRRLDNETRGQDVEGRLRARVGALEAELQVATRRLNASTRELTATAMELEASTQRLTEAGAAAATIEADIEHRRKAHPELQQQKTDALVEQAIPKRQSNLASTGVDAYTPSLVKTGTDALSDSPTSAEQAVICDPEHNTASELRLHELLADLTAERERMQVLLKAMSQTQDELDSASKARDVACARVAELLAANELAQGEVERLSAACHQDQVQITELEAMLDSVSNTAESRLGAIQAAQGELHDQLRQAEDRARTLQAQLEEQVNALHAVALARDNERRHSASLEATLAAVKSLNSALWSQLGTIAGAVRMDIDTAPKGLRSHVATGPIPDGDVVMSVSDVGQALGLAVRVSESQLAHGIMAPPRPGDSSIGADEYGQSLQGASSSLNSFGTSLGPSSQHKLHEGCNDTEPSPVWSDPLNFKAALLTGAARSAAAALQTVGDVPISPPCKSAVLRSSFASTTSSPDTAHVASGNSTDRSTGDLPVTAMTRTLPESHGDGKRKPSQKLAAATQQVHRGCVAAVPHASLEQRGLQLLQPEYATPASLISLDVVSSHTVRDDKDVDDFNVLPDVAAAVQLYLDSLHAEVATLREMDLTAARGKIETALKQVTELQSLNEDLMRERKSWRGTIQQTSGGDGQGPSDSNTHTISKRSAEGPSYDNVSESPARLVTAGHTVTVTSLEADKGMEDGRMAAQRQAPDVQSNDADLLQNTVEGNEAAALAQRRLDEVQSLYVDVHQQLLASEASCKALQSRLDEAERAHGAAVEQQEAAKASLKKLYNDADTRRAAAEQQLSDAQASIADLQQRLSAAEAAAASTQQQVSDVEARCADLQQQQTAVEASRNALEAKLAHVEHDHAVIVGELEEQKASLQKWYNNVEASRVDAEQRLNDMQVLVSDLQERLAAADEAAALAQPRISETEVSRADLEQLLVALDCSHNSLKAKLDEANRAHITAVEQLEAASRSLQNQYNDVQAARAVAEQHLDEAQAAIVDLQQRLSAAEETAASAQRRVSVVQASQADLHQQQAAAEAGRNELQAKLDHIERDYAATVGELEEARASLQKKYDDVETSRIVVAQQLSEARAAIADLQQRLFVSDEATSLIQRQMSELQMSHADLQQQLLASKASREVFRAQLEGAEHAHAATVEQLEAINMSLQKQYDNAMASRSVAEQQLNEARATVLDLQQRLSVADKACALVQRQLNEVEASRAELQQQLMASEASREALQAKLDESEGAHSAAIERLEEVRLSMQKRDDDVEAGRVVLERQLSEEQVTVKDLQQRLLATEEVATSAQRKISEVEGLRSGLLQELKTSETSRGALQNELDEIDRGYTAAVSELEASKLVLQQQLADAEAGRTTAEAQLTEARANIDYLMRRLSAAGEDMIVMQQLMGQVKELCGELQCQVVAAEKHHSALQASFHEATRSVSAVKAEFEAAKERLLRLYENSEASRSLAQEQLAEARSAFKNLQQRMTAAEERSASSQQQVGEVEASRSAMERQLSSVKSQLSAKEAELRTLLERIGALNDKVTAVSALVEDHHRSSEARSSPAMTMLRSLPSGFSTWPIHGDIVASVADMRASLTSRLEAASKEAAAHAARGAELSHSLVEAQALVAKLEALLEESNAELRAAAARVQELEQLLCGKEKKLLEQELDMQAVARELEVLQQRFTALQVDVEGARDNAEGVSAQLDEYKLISRQQCQEAELARNEALLDATAVREELESLRGALLETEAQRARLAAVEVELSKVEAQMESLQRGIRISEAQADELRAELAATQYDLISAREERDDAIRQLHETREEAGLKLDDYQQQIDRLRQELDEVGMEHSCLLRELAEKATELSAVRDEQQALLVQAGTNFEAMKQQLTESRAKLNAVETEFLDTRKDLADARGQVQAALLERDNVKAQLAEVQATKQVELLNAIKELAEAQNHLKVELSGHDTAAARLTVILTEKQAELFIAMKELGETRKELQAVRCERDMATSKLAEAVTEKQAELHGVAKPLQTELSGHDTAAAKPGEALTEEQAEPLFITTVLADAGKKSQEAQVDDNLVAGQLKKIQAEHQAEVLSLKVQMAEARKLQQEALSQRDAAVTNLAEAEKRIASARETADAKRTEHDATLRLLEAALSAKDTACSDLSSIRTELLATVSMLSEVRGDRDSALHQMEELHVEARSLRDTVSMLAKQLADAQDKIQIACEQRDFTKVRITELEGQIAATRQLLASVHEAIESKRAEHQDTVMLLDRSLAEKDTLSNDLASARSQILTALEELSDERAQRDAAMLQLNAVRDVLSAIDDETNSSAAAATVTAAVMREQQRTVEVQQRNLDASRASEVSRVAEHLRVLDLRADGLNRHAEDLQRRLNAAEPHLSSERAEAEAVRARLELHLTSARTEVEAMAAERTAALQQLTGARTELLDVTGKCVDLEEKVRSLEQLSKKLKGQLSSVKQELADAESRVAAERLRAEMAWVKVEELQGKLRADLASAHTELMAVAAQRDARDAQLAVVLPTLSAAQAEHAAGLRQISTMKGEQVILENHLIPLEEHAKILERQADDLRQKVAAAEARHVAEKCDAQNDISRLEACLEATRTELSAVAASRDVSTQQVGQLRSENVELSAARTTLEGQVRGLQQHIDHLQKQASALQGQLTAAETRLRTERTEVHSARTQAAAVRAELATVMSERDTLANQAATLRTELASVRADRESIVQQQASAVHANAKLEDQVHSLQQHITQLQGQLTDMGRLREQLTDTEKKLITEQGSRTAAERLLAIAKAEVGEVNGQLAALRKELAAVTKELAAQQALTESRVGEMQTKVAQARTQASEESEKVQRLQGELAEVKSALQDSERQLIDQDVDAKGMVAGLQEALETTRATLEAERARGDQKAKELQELLHGAITRESSAHNKLNQLRMELDAARTAQKASQVFAEAKIAALEEELLDAQRALRNAQEAAFEQGLAQEAELKASVQAANKAAAFSQQRIAFFDAQIAAVRAAEAEAQRALLDARQGMDQKEAEAASRIANLEERLAAAQESIALLESRHKHAEDVSRNAEDELVAMCDKLRVEQERTSLLEPRIATLAENVATLQAELANARTALSRYEAYAIDAETEIQELRNAAEVSSEENVRLQQQLDQLVDQLRRQTQQLRAAEADTAQLRQDVAAMNFTGARRSRSTSRGPSVERRHGSAGRVTAGGRTFGGVASILEDPANSQQRLILRKPQHMSRQPVSTVVSRSGEVKASQPARPGAGSVEPRRQTIGSAQERQTADTGVDSGFETRSSSPASLLQKRLTDEATQLRWEVVADSSRVRELQEKRAGGVYLTRAEVAEMELLTARLGAHHARISAIMDTVRLARVKGSIDSGAARVATDTTSQGHEYRRAKSPTPTIASDSDGKRNACQQAPLMQQGSGPPSDLEYPDQPRQHPLFHPHPPVHPPMQHTFAGVGTSGADVASAVDNRTIVQRSSPVVSPPVRGKSISDGSKTPSRMRFYDLETRAEPAEHPRAPLGTSELHSGRREAIGWRDDVRRLGTPKYARDNQCLSPNQNIDPAHAGDEYGSENSTGQAPSGSGSISPHTLGLVYSAFPSPSSQNIRSTMAIINVSPWYPPGASPARMISPVRAASPVNVAGRALPNAADNRVHYNGRSGGATPVRERVQEGIYNSHIVDTDEAVGVASSVMPAVGGEAVDGGPGPGPRAATRYRTPYLRMLQDMVQLGQVGGSSRGGGAAGSGRRTGGASEVPRLSHAIVNVAVPVQYSHSDAGLEATSHWGSGGGADGSQGPMSSHASPGACSRGQSPSKEHAPRPLYMPSDIGPGL